MAHSFANMPSVAISRSKFDRVSRHPLSFNLGQIIPLYIDEVLPGDTRKLDVSTLIRMSTPIAPIMDDIEMDIFAFFVPNRLAFDKWKEVMGENNVGAGIPVSTYTVPKVTITNGVMPVGSVGDHMGLPNVSSSYAASVLPLRGYKLIYNRWFRNQNVTAPVTNDIGTSTTYDDYTIDPYIAVKKPDYFTRALPYAQKGNPVTIPLGTVAPVYAGQNAHDIQTYGAYPMKFKNSNGTNIGVDGILGIKAGTQGTVDLSKTSPGELWDGHPVPANLYADLSLATAATINSLRLAFQTQKLLEKDSLYGTRYYEILFAHFGVRSPDASLQDPEYLGGSKFMINIDQVLSTAGYDNTSSTEVGQPGANSVTGWKGSLFTKSFTEHGFLHVYGVARQKHRTYGQGLNRMFARSGRYDFYWPVFANLGAQEVKNEEILAGNSGNFGYQEAWAEYRYKPSIVSGILNPSRSGSLDYWTLAEAFGSLPTLGDTFMKEDRANLARALTTGVSGPDFIGDFYFKDVSVRPMPTYSIPGLIDHH